MLFIVAALLGGAFGSLRGGHLSNLTDLSLRWSALPLLAVGLQAFVIHGPGKAEAGPYTVPALVILASYGLLLITVLVNLRLPGMAWLGLGVALNLLVMVVNGGWMPVTPDLLATAGFAETPSAILPGQRVLASKDVVMVSQEIHLRWLSDMFIMSKLGILSAVFSVGDVVMMLGVFQLIHVSMTKRTERAPQHFDRLARN